MRKSWLVLIAAVLLVSACESTPDSAADASAAGGGAQTTTGTPGYSFDPNAANGGNQMGQDVADRVFFALDSSEVTAEGRATLDKQAAWLKTRPNLKATIEGHCDERGTREYNLALGERRATSAKNYLVSLGVPESQVSTISYGKERPAVEGSDEAAWAQNRRAVTVVQ